MDKKWLIYLGDRHEGPFSGQEIVEKVKRGEFPPEAYVWAEGMEDWLPLETVPEFQALGLAPRAATSAAAAGAPSSGAAAKPVASEPQTQGSLSLAQPKTPSSLTQGTSSLSTSLATGSSISLAGAASSTAPGLLSGTNSIQLDPTQSGRSVSQVSRVSLDTGRRGADGKEPAVMAEKAQDVTATASKTLRPSSASLPGKGSAFVAASGGGRSQVSLLQLLGGLSSRLKLGLALMVCGAVGALILGKKGAAGGESAAAGGVGGSGGLTQWVQGLPGLRLWLNRLPAIEDVSAEELEQLKRAANAPEDGLPFALAKSLLGPLTPSFYITSSLRQPLELELWVVGIPETLLAQGATASVVVPVKLSSHLFKTDPLRSKKQDFLSKGEYNLFLVPTPASLAVLAALSQGAATASTSPSSSLSPAPFGMKTEHLVLPPELAGRPVLAVKTYFLGGAKNADYKARLSEQHAHRKKQLENELLELRQFEVTLNHQLASTVSFYQQLRATATRAPASSSSSSAAAAAMLLAWQSFHNQWLGLFHQLDQEFARWTPEFLQKEQRLFVALYPSIRELGRVILTLHGYQNSAMRSEGGQKQVQALETQIFQFLPGVQTRLVEIQGRLSRAEKALAQNPHWLAAESL